MDIAQSSDAKPKQLFTADILCQFSGTVCIQNFDARKCLQIDRSKETLSLIYFNAKGEEKHRNAIQFSQIEAIECATSGELVRLRLTPDWSLDPNADGCALLRSYQPNSNAAVERWILLNLTQKVDVPHSHSCRLLLPILRQMAMLTSRVSELEFEVLKEQFVEAGKGDELRKVKYDPAGNSVWSDDGDGEYDFLRVTAARRRSARRSGMLSLEYIDPSDCEKIAFYYPPNGTLCVKRDDVHRLKPDRMLSDAVMDAYIQYVWLERVCKQTSLRHRAEDTLLLNSFFFHKLKQWYKSDREGKALKRWIKVDLLSKRYVLFPVNEDIHWSLVVIVNPVAAIAHAKYSLATKADQAKDRAAQKENAKANANDNAKQKHQECESQNLPEGALQITTVDSGDEQSPSAAAVEAVEAVEEEEAPIPGCILHMCSLSSHTTMIGPMVRACLQALHTLASSVSATTVVAETEKHNQEKTKDCGKSEPGIGTDQEVREAEEVPSVLFTPKSMPLYNVRVPQQHNATDCGFYALEYLQRFVESPPVDEAALHNRTKLFANWFDASAIDQKRSEMICIFQRMEREYEAYVAENQPNGAEQDDDSDDGICVMDKSRT